MSLQTCKPFSWSWSKLKNFRTCPKRHYHVDIAKDFKEDDSEDLLWGNEVHEALAKRIGKGMRCRHHAGLRGLRQASIDQVPHELRDQ